MGTLAPGIDPEVDEYTESVTGEIPHDKPEPIDVRVIESAPVEDRTARTFTTIQVSIPNGQSVRLVPEMRTRKCLSLTTSAAVALGREGVTAGTGFLLIANQGNPFQITGTDALYAVANGADAVVSVLVELAEG